MNIKRLHLLLLTSILIVGFAVRLYGLDKTPFGFFCDEAAIGYNAYAILLTGKDEYGTDYPVFFRSFGEFKSPVAIYATVPFVKIFGLNELSVRLQSVMFGMLTILMVYAISRQLLSKHVALLSAAIAATMPWLIHYNRTGFELNSYTALFTTTVFLLIKAVKQKSYIIPAFLVASLTLYTYYSAKLIVPLFIVGFLALYGKHIFKYKREAMVSGVLFFIVSIPFLISFITGEGTARFHEVSVFSAKLSVPESLLLIVSNYFFQLSPTLFIFGEPTFITRHFTEGLTPLLLVTVPFFYIGIASLLHSRKKLPSQLLLWWLLLYPLGAALTKEAPFTGRTVIGAPLSAILISLGIVTVIHVAKKYVPQRVPIGIIAAAIVVNFMFFLLFYFISYPKISSDFWGWQAGPSEIVQYFEENKQRYDEAYLIGEFNAPYIFFNFYAPHGCENCKLGEPDKFYDPTRKQLFAVTPHYLKTHPEIRFAARKFVYYPNNKVAFIIGEVQPHLGN